MGYTVNVVFLNAWQPMPAATHRYDCAHGCHCAPRQVCGRDAVLTAGVRACAADVAGVVGAWEVKGSGSAGGRVQSWSKEGVANVDSASNTMLHAAASGDNGSHTHGYALTTLTDRCFGATCLLLMPNHTLTQLLIAPPHTCPAMCPPWVSLFPFPLGGQH